MEEDKYKAALERAKSAIKECGNNLGRIKMIESIFPELKESEEEKVRKQIINHLDFLARGAKGMDNSPEYSKYTSWIAYLEKLKDIDKKMEEAYKNGDGVFFKKGYDEGYVEGMAFAKQELEKQAAIKDGNSIDPHFGKSIAINESKVDVEVEPSWFHHKVDLSGNSEEYRKAYYDGWNNCAQQYIQYKSESNDVIRCLIHGMEQLKDDRIINWGTDKWHMKVEDILHGLRNLVKNKVATLFKVGDWVVNNVTHNLCHIVKAEHGQYICDDCSFPINKENEYHPWSIADAKDGDVLVNGSNIFIFHFINGTRLMGYCHVNIDDGRFYDDLGKNECFCLIDAIVTPATKEQRELLFRKMEEAEYAWNPIAKGLSHKEVSKKSDKVEWNDEDQDFFGLLEGYLEFDYTLSMNDKANTLDWLKSIKERLQ